MIHSVIVLYTPAATQSQGWVTPLSWVVQSLAKLTRVNQIISLLFVATNCRVLIIDYVAKRFVLAQT